MKFIASAIVTATAIFALACSGSNSSGTSNRTGGARATLTGCLKSGDEPGSYVLQMASAADVATPGTSSSTPSSSGDATGERTFRVVADQKNDLAGHVNQRVVVDGYVESGKTVIATGTAGMRSNTTSSGYGATNMQASPDTIGHGSSSQLGNGTAIATSGTSASGSPDHTVDRTESNRSTEPTSGGGITQESTGTGMRTLRADSIRKVADSCIEGTASGTTNSSR